MLRQHNYSGLADRFGYALAHGRAPAAAIEADFLNCAASSRITTSPENPSILVKFFAPNDTGLVAVVECNVPVHEETAVLLELIVTVKGEERHTSSEGR